MIFKKKISNSKHDALLCIPEKNSIVKEKMLDSGDLVLFCQAVYTPFFQKIQNMIHKNPNKTFTRKIQLDHLGVDVWTLIDGKRDTKTIITNFSKLHSLNYKESEISVTLFLRSLGKKGLIGIREP